MNLLDMLLWGVLPYVMLAVLVGGTVWRYRYDKFGWTTRSSELYESRLLRIGSPLFHFGLLVVIVGHVIGLVIPKSWTDAVGLSQEAYHLQALLLGTVAGFSTLAGIAILVYRRRTTGPVFRATTRNDKLMYVVLVAAIVAGLATTLLGAGGRRGAQLPRSPSSPWFRSLFVLQPDVAAMSACRRSPSSSTRSSAWRCSRSGLSPGSCTPSPRRWATCSGPTSSTAPRAGGPAARAGAPRLGTAGACEVRPSVNGCPVSCDALRSAAGRRSARASAAGRRAAPASPAARRRRGRRPRRGTAPAGGGCS